VFGTLRETLQEPCGFCAPARPRLAVAEAVDIVEAKHLGAIRGFAAVTCCQVPRIRSLMSIQATFTIADPPAGLAKSLEIRCGNTVARLHRSAI
jgi:hypothetical protein